MLFWHVCGTSVYFITIYLLWLLTDALSKHTHTHTHAHSCLCWNGNQLVQTELRVCLFGPVKATDLDWFMTQKQRLYYSQEQKIWFLTLCGTAHRLLCQVYKTRPVPWRYFHSVKATTDTYNVSWEGDSAGNPLCLREKENMELI